MKTDTYTKTVLSLIFLALLMIAGAKSREEMQAVHAAAPTRPQAWEYKFLLFSHWYSSFTGSYTEQISEDGKKLNINGQGINQKIYDLGSQGWELVTVEAESEYKDSSGFYARAGATTDITWTFKRPKQ